MNPRKIALAVTTLASAAFLSIAGAQAAADHAHAAKHAGMHHHHHRAAGPVAAGADLAVGAAETAGAIVAAPFGGKSYAGNGYFGSSAWGDYDCSPGYAGCRPYATKDWSKP